MTNAKPQHGSDGQMPEAEEDLYKILGLESTATPEAIKTAYKKNALKHHPDKASENTRDAAHAKFQQIALAYSVLSDERRRKVYDRTGSTDEVFGEDGDFDWMDFYREQLSAMLDTRAIDDFRKKYKGSDEETKDILAAYDAHEGDMDGVYDSVMLSNVLDDDARFRGIIDQAIADGKAEDYPRYSQETDKRKEQRVKRARKEAKEAEKLAKEVEENKKKKRAAASKKGPAAGDDDLLSMITKRQQQRGQGFLAHLEEKYGAPNNAKKRGPPDEPSEEAFAAVGARKKSTKKK
ncbi:hypothetical protein N7474_003403 [Penicillium riverlandense]|uniref:uncharacterized protein n=1 Tax=Penicillium riverlandense TaxID=1903569 RepID=UPI0025476B57|nr:uncharacterized protein N7474_003403 [Penicillium riverlandense]KAJ5826265.1 hypothetical protein N7474_003403 [Penicillium riverlandense]